LAGARAWHLISAPTVADCQQSEQEGLIMAEFEIQQIEAVPAAVIHAEVPMGEITGFYDRAFPRLMAAIAAQGATPAGAPFGLYPRMPGDTIEIVAGIPIDRPIVADGEVEPYELPGGRAIVAMHIGPYDTLADTYHRIWQWASGEGLTMGELMWESYLTDPGDGSDPATWATQIVWPVAGGSSQ